MFDKEYTEMLLDSRLDGQTSAVLGVQAAYIAAICSALAFMGMLMIITMKHIFIEIDSHAATIGVGLMASLFLLCGFSAIWFNTSMNFDEVKNHLKKGRKYWH